MRKLWMTTALGAALLLAPSALSQSLSTPVLFQSSAMTLDAERGVLTMAPLLERVTPTVVSIQTQGKAAPRDEDVDEFFERFFGQRPGARQAIS